MPDVIEFGRQLDKALLWEVVVPRCTYNQAQKLMVDL